MSSIRYYLILILIPLLCSTGAKAQFIKGEVEIEATEADKLPTSAEVLYKIGMGWNLGHSFESTLDETSMGNPRTSQKIIDCIKKQGFNAVRIPVLFNPHLNSDNLLSRAWLKRIVQVIDYCMKDDMYVIISGGYTNGWIKFNGGREYDLKQIVAIRSIWEQMAKLVGPYDEHVILAFGHHVDMDVKTDLDKFVLLQQNFIDAVRLTGGKNLYRTLLIQGPNDDVSNTAKYMHMPSDYYKGYLGLEVSFYTPWQFCRLQEDEPASKCAWFWGKDNRQERIDGVDRNAPMWAETNFMEMYFPRLKAKYVDNDIPIVVGESGVMHRVMANSKLQKAHDDSRYSFMYEYCTRARNAGLVPFVYDDGRTGENNMGIIRRSDLTIFDTYILKALVDGVAASKYPKSKASNANRLH